MFHDDAAFEFPFGTSGPVHIEGKAAMAAYLAKIEGMTLFDRFDLKAAYPIQDDGMVLEYHCQARTGGSGARLEQHYVAVIRTWADRIGFYREYFDPLNIPGVPGKAASTPLDQTPLERPVRSLDEILKSELGGFLDPAAETLLDMFAGHGVLECPFAPPGAVRRLAGKEAVGDYYRKLTAIQGSDGMVLTASYPAEDAAYGLLEYDGTVRNKRDGGTYRQRYLTVVALADGRMTLFR